MASFEMKEELYYMICLIVIPFISSIYFYKTHPHKIWLSVIAIVALDIIASLSFYPYVLEKLMRLELDHTAMYWLVFVLPTQVVSALFFTVVSAMVIGRSGGEG